MANTKKAQSLAREFGDRLDKRLRALATPITTLEMAFDTDGNPYWTFGPGTAAGANALVKIKPIDWTLAKDVLGNSANMYANHVVQLVTEKSVIGTGAGDYLTIPQLLPVLGEALALGCRFEWYQDTNGTAPTLADIVASKLKATFEPNMYFPLISDQ